MPVNPVGVWGFRYCDVPFETAASILDVGRILAGLLYTVRRDTEVTSERMISMSSMMRSIEK